MIDKQNVIASEPDFSRGAVYPGSVSIDFSTAVKLDTTGTTCNAYRVRKDNTLLFVKKLKEEFAFHPVYRDALQKELSIGQSLEHECLPVYHYAIDDYIVLNYIDGDTLAHLIGNDDKWLHSDKNIVSVLTKLVDVIGYLHKKGVVHCDVKTDNVMITHNNHNIKLIDLDKCYTDSRVFSPGSPKLYGAERAGSPDNDFNGLAIIAETLSKFASKSLRKRIYKVIEACHKAGVGTDELLALLTAKKGHSVYLVPTLIVLAIAILLVIFLQNSGDTDNQEKDTDIPAQILSENEGKVLKQESTTETLEDVVIEQQKITVVKPNSSEIDRVLSGTYQPLYDKIAEIEQTNIEELTARQLSDIITQLFETQQEVWNNGFSKFREYYPDLDYSPAYEIYIKQPAFQQMTSRVNKISEKLTPYIERANQD